MIFIINCTVQLFFTCKEMLIIFTGCLQGSDNVNESFTLSETGTGLCRL